MKELKPGMLCLLIPPFEAQHCGETVEIIQYLGYGDSVNWKGDWWGGDGDIGHNYAVRFRDGDECVTTRGVLLPLEDDGDNETMDESVESTMGMEVE